MRNIVFIGFDNDEVPISVDDRVCLIYQEEFDEINSRETMLSIKKIVGDTDAIVVNLKKENLTPEEVVVLHSAYTISTPIFAVGYKILTPVVKEMVTRRFGDLEHLLDHISAYYTMGN